MENEEERGLSRRAAFVTAGAGALLSLSFSSPASAALSTSEQSNVKTVNALADEMSADNPDLRKIGELLTDDCALHMQEGKPPAEGKASTIQALKNLLDRGMRFKFTVHETFAKGHIVAHYRDDKVIVGDKQTTIPLVGVFVMKDGKIREWFDYIIQT